jgi:hypothetical protein
MSVNEDLQGSDEAMLLGLQRETFDFFVNQVDPHTGLVADCTRPNSPASIAGTGLGLAVYIVGIERKFISRNEGLKYVLRILRFFHASHQGVEKDATGYKGFYYHFLDKKTGKRAWDCELSTIDTALLMVGMLVAAAYFDKDQVGDQEVRGLVQGLYARVDWRWALNEKKMISHGWKPESGFLSGSWDKGYSEAHILYMLAIGAPQFSIDPSSYQEWIKTFQTTEFYGYRYLYAGPLFIHQMSQIWLDFRGIQDEANRKIGFDYFENSKRATYAQRAYGIDNPLKFKNYSENEWGITASDGPGPADCEIDGVKRHFYNYIARGAPGDIDDGTISPWAVVTSLPFAPEIVTKTIRHAIERLHLKTERHVKGFDASFNPSFPEYAANRLGWVSEWRFSLNQGPIILMIENYYSGLIWNLLKKNPHLNEALKRAGFRKPEQP